MIKREGFCKKAAIPDVSAGGGRGIGDEDRNHDYYARAMS
jgi:hypothetical protein